MKVRIENIDDLWHLSNIIREYDRVFSITQRREESPADRIREKRGEKKTVYLGINVERLEFHEFSDRLRVHGTILSDQLDSGSYHTFNLQVGSEITIVKNEWKDYEIQRMRQAIEDGRRSVVMIVSMDDDDAMIAVLRQSGIQELATVMSGRSGKRYNQGSSMKKEVYFEEICTVMKQQGSDIPVIVSGPGFAKEDFLKYLTNGYGESFPTTLAVSTGHGGRAGINEVLMSSAVSRIADGSRVAYETDLMEMVLKELSTDGKIAYGQEEVRGSIENGAADKVLVADSLIRESRTEAEEIIKSAETAGAKVVIISVSHDSGRQLESLGGCAALLRYKMR